MKLFKIKNFFLNIQFIFRPQFWLFNYKYSKKNDEYLNYLMDVCEPSLDRKIDGEFYEIKFTYDLFNVSVRIVNYPYAYGLLVNRSGLISHHYRPSKLTILRLRKLEKKLKKIEYEKRKHTIGV